MCANRLYPEKSKMFGKIEFKVCSRIPKIGPRLLSAECPNMSAKIKSERSCNECARENGEKKVKLWIA